MVDATTGLGGHTAAVLARFPRVRVVGLDRDPNAVAAARANLAQYSDRVSVHHARYDEMGGVLDEFGIQPAAKVEPLPVIELDDIRLIAWMAVSGSAEGDQ